MAHESAVMSDEAYAVTGGALQSALVELLDLSLLAKQAHWNLFGSRFRSLHLQFDELATATRDQADLVAERASTVGISPDGQAATVARSSALTPFPPGWVRNTEALATLVEDLTAVVGRMRARVARTGEHDPVTQDLLIGVTAVLEKHTWMLRAEAAQED